MLYLDRSDSQKLSPPENREEDIRHGKIGAIKQWEGFGVDHFLPKGTGNGGCYSKTYAPITVMMLIERLLHLGLDRRYADIIEVSLLNTVLTAINLSGKGFTYENQLASSDKDPSVRHDWFICACHPPNLIRVLGCLAGYLGDHGTSNVEAFVNVHMYTSAKLDFEV